MITLQYALQNVRGNTPTVQRCQGTGGFQEINGKSIVKAVSHKAGKRR